MAVEEDKVQAKGYDLIAGQVYLLMKKDYHVSRNVRLQWFLEHINSTVTVDDPIQKHGEEVIVLSIVPLDPPSEWNYESSHLYHYLVTSATEIICLSESYSAVFCLDMSPSISTVDIQRGRVMIDEILISLRRSVEGFINSFRIPGSTRYFEPIVFATVIVHTPFFTTPAQQVLVQGWKLTKVNVVEFLSAIEKQLQLLEDNIAHVSGLVHDQLAEVRQRQFTIGRKWEIQAFLISADRVFSEVGHVVALSLLQFVLVLSENDRNIKSRYGMLALRLLPPSSCPNLVVITDGMITLPDIHVLDSVLSQLRNNAVAVSFLHVGSQFHPHCALGLVPYVELMQFIALATTGSYIPSPPAVVFPDMPGKMNIYQISFLTWSFMKGGLGIEPYSGELSKGEWCVRNRRFDGNREPQLLTKKQSEDSLNVTLSSVLCCRMREGYFVKSVYLKDEAVDLCLVLPWSNHIYIEYYVSSDWPPTESVRYAISIKAPYEFLHDITCLIKKPFHSPYRQAVVSRFWSTLKTLNHADLLLSHLDSFENNPATYTLPDSIRSGMPLFYLPSDSSQPVLSSNDIGCPQFAHFWRLISALDPGVWQKYLHTHRLGVVLTHDRPLPQFLHTPNPNGRFQSVQCRYAASTLFNFLKDWTSFVLIENHSYIKFITPSESYDKVQTWFFIIRVTSKPPCVVLHVAFLGNTPGYLRNLAIETLKEKLNELKFPIRPTKKEHRQTSRKETNVGDQQQQMTECCMLLKKPLEKMLIRYERMPSEFGTVVFPDGTQPLIAAKPLRPASSLVTTLSRYLYHRRWVWSASARPGTSYSFGRAPLARLLANLTRMRLDEGFRFAHSTAGIINMVLEVNMKCFDEGTRKTDILPCVIQYVLFPPHTVFVTSKTENSDDEGAGEGAEEDQSELHVELISECWIEPQHGVVTRSPPNRFYMENLRYYQLADVMWWNDAECISSLLTFEHLRLMCQDSSVVIPEPITLKTIPNPLEKWPNAVALADERIQKVPFAYNLMNILPKCQQAQILFSLFIQELVGNVETKTSADTPNCLLMETFYENLKDLHDRDMCLSKEDSKKLIDLIIQREKDNVSLAEEVKEFSEGSTSKTGSNEALEVPMIGDWKRMICWATGDGDPEADTRRPQLHHSWQRRQKAVGASASANTPPVPVQWKCFVKALSSSRCILTLVPASFQDVKVLADFSEEFPASRLRANSWDMMRQSTASIRARTSSVGARVTSRTGDTCGTSDTCSTSRHSITLPLFVYDCLVSNLIDANSVKTGNDIFIDKTNETADDPSSERDSDNSDITLEELSLREHCKMVMQSFNNAFVVSLFKSLRLGNSIHAVDVKTAVEECEESSVEIDITNYLKTVCGHLKELFAENQVENTDSDVLLSVFKHPGPCLDYKHLHKLIKNKFLRILTASFKAVSSDPKYYFCSPMWERDRQNCSNQKKRNAQKSQETATKNLKVVSTPFGHDDSLRVLESSNEFDSLHFTADISDLRCDQISMHGQSGWEGVANNCVTTPDDARTSLIANMDSDSISNFPDDESVEEVSPLFLHLDCSLNSAGDSNNCTVKIIPTCLNELLDVDNNKLEKLNLSDMKVVLRLVLTAKTSTQPPLSQPATTTDTSTPQLHHLPDNQQKAVAQCVKEIEWLMHDEIAAFMLDVVPVSQETLQFVSHHVETSVNRPSCLHQLVPLKFVFGLEHSMGCFLKDLAQMTIPGYCLQKEGDYYFLIKDENSKTQKSNEESFCNYSQSGEFWVSSTGSQTNDDKKSIDSPSWTRTSDMRSCSQEFNKSSISGWSSVAAWHHNVSSLMENGLAAEDIYNVEHMDESSDWLSDLERRRAILPNFWLIMKVDKESVSTYFHCRFLELETQKVKLYSLIQRSVVKNISEVCKVVNQTMLLQNLHNTRLCNPLLEPETTDDDTWTSSPKIQSQVGGRIDLESGFPEGIFACNVVWKTHFALHPRLKTGPGKPRLSRAIQALQTVLNRFSVNNRNNMFVYQDKNENVFYLRLYEKTQIRTIDVEDGSPGSVSRSSSINSLNREYNKRVLDDQISVNKEPPRPRLKSFGESGDGSFTSKQEDFITLQVHGIYEAGSEVKLELVQVLQNRLNDAVLEVVSVMLARNPMCKLSPEDVHFIQKPNSTPDNFIKFTIPLHATSYLQALAYFLRQNLLQFLHMPKYTDSRIHNHFQDYTYPNDSTRKIPEENILLYNQSHSSGNKGIACIGFSVVNADGSLLVARDQCPIPSSDAYYKKPLSESEFHPFTETSTISDQEISESAGDSTFIEFRVWKQGRVNIESLTHMLKASIRHTLWDLLMEYNLLTAPLTQPSAEQEKLVDQELAPIHQTITVPWLKLAVSMGVPAVKPLYINLTARHPVDVTLKEVFNLVSVSDATGCYVFYKSAQQGDERLVHLPQVTSDIHMNVSSCVIIGRNLTFWKACHTNDPESAAVRNDKAHSISSDYPLFCDSSSDSMLFIPRRSSVY
ncbi:KICSTOR complex protein SZT2, partial [Nilaparvata lugens]|uniref:KICSTOR complex protein SZT2 n=1 Tax=Nilaparvata lugens TaxID=108931 RepID=UPI00193CAE48